MLTFIANGKELAQGLQRLQALMGAQLENVLLQTTEETVELHAAGNSRRSMVVITANCSEIAQIVLAKPALEALCKSRDKMQFSLKENKLFFVSGKFSGNLLTIGLDVKPDLIKFSKVEPILTKEIQENLQEAIRKCQLQSVYDVGKLSIFIQEKNKQLYVGVADDCHASFMSVASIKNSVFEKPFLLPMEYGLLLTTQFKHCAVNFGYQNRNVVFQDDKSIVELPALQTQNSVLDQLLSVETKPLYQLDITELNKVLQSCTLKNASMLFIAKKGKRYMSVKFSSDSGDMEDQVLIVNKNKRNVRLQVDLLNFRDLIKKLNGSAEVQYNSNTLKVMQDNFVGYSQLLQAKNEN